MRSLIVGAVLMFGSLGVIWLGVTWFQQRAVNAQKSVSEPYVPPPVLSPQHRGP